MNAPSERPRGEITVHVFARTDVGRTREHNEDTFLVADLTEMNASLHPEVRTHTPGQRGSLFMVADGMGGAAAGEIASAMATQVVLRELEARWGRASDTEPETFVRALKAAAEAANTRIHRYAADHPENRGMGTTATIAGFLGDTLYLAQVGDSRAYLVRGGAAQQLTKDQSLMQKLVEAGELTAEEAEVSERRNIILQALGPEPQVKVDLTHQQVRRGDVLVLCSDGLSGQVRPDDIARIVTGTEDLSVACRRMIDLANENGGPDNITVIAVRFEGDGLGLSSSDEAVGHRAFASGEDQRITTPVELAAIYTPSVPRANGASGAAGGTSLADVAPVAPVAPVTPLAPLGVAPDTPYETPSIISLGTASPGASETTPEDLRRARGRLSERTLRLIFGAIGVAVGAVILYRLLRAK